MVGAIVTPALLSSIRSTPHLPNNVYFFLACSTLSTLNLPSEIPHVLRFALERGGGCNDSKPEHEDQLKIVRKMRESIIKLVAIAGLPKSINAMNALKSATPPNLVDEPLGYSPTGRPSEIFDVPQSAVLHRGQQLFNDIYGKVAGGVMRNMDRLGTEDLGLMARLMYGYALSNTSVLSARDTSYVLVAGLIPQDVGSSFPFWKMNSILIM